ncbi:hypothetical protein [Nocardia donostiensis]|uniref:Condensation domain-containing protein n=1 Tax=Nocardia donostiensis TaxID=1538463 RepID=A0A1V2TFT8_9NOCA|nr:hypothetical protein [Nocardia donostiensis]ONM48365.1 hypothetical protein B0T46_13415 [Nocardia donostiensis]OQS20525.1 hypothetical protein B0T44_09560 [Nocardia donostiensis]
MPRLSVVDEIFLRAHRGLGTPIALQGLWRTAEPVEPALLRQVHETLRTGPLGRRVVPSGVPGARPFWRRNVSAHPLDLTDHALPAARLLGWADSKGHDLDPGLGPGWRLSAAPLDDGGTIVALTCSHVLADARGLILAVDHALGGPPTRSDTEPLASDWSDARRQWSTIIRGTASALISAVPWLGAVARSGTGSTVTVGQEAVTVRQPIDCSGKAAEPAGRVAGCASREAGPAGYAAGSARRPTGWVAGFPEHLVTAARRAEGTGKEHSEMPAPGVVLRCPVGEWERIAADRGGTANSLFIWFVANTLWASGFPKRTIQASLPVDTRTDRLVVNDLAMTDIAITPDDDPATIRHKSRAAYEHRMSSPGGLPEEWLQVVPARVAYLMSRGAGERDILCSNIGTLPPTVLHLGPHACTGVAARAIHPGLTFARRPRTRISGYLCRAADEYTLTLISLEPDLLPSSAAVRRSAERTAIHLGIPLSWW